jgi:hypothetical protein
MSGVRARKSTGRALDWTRMSAQIAACKQRQERNICCVRIEIARQKRRVLESRDRPEPLRRSGLVKIVGPPRIAAA